MKPVHALFAVLGAGVGLWWYSMPFTPAAATALDGATPVTVCGPETVAPPLGVVQLDGAAAPFRLKSATVTPFARFAVNARVLSATRYRFDPGAKWAPVDLALGWGPMAAPRLPGLHVSQSGRWYHTSWGASGPPIPPEQIERNSANMHLIPATREVSRQLTAADRGDVVTISGFLVDIADGQGSWRSSRTREDTGDGACELVYVCSVRRGGSAAA